MSSDPEEWDVECSKKSATVSSCATTATVDEIQAKMKALQDEVRALTEDRDKLTNEYNSLVDDREEKKKKQARSLQEMQIEYLSNRRKIDKRVLKNARKYEEDQESKAFGGIFTCVIMLLFGLYALIDFVLRSFGVIGNDAMSNHTINGNLTDTLVSLPQSP